MHLQPTHPEAHAPLIGDRKLPGDIIVVPVFGDNPIKLPAYLVEAMEVHAMGVDDVMDDGGPMTGTIQIQGSIQ